MDLNKSVLFLIDDLIGHIIPTFHLAEILKKDGYEVSYLGESHLEEYIEKIGFKYFSYPSKEYDPFFDALSEGRIIDIVSNINCSIIITVSHQILEALVLSKLLQIKVVVYWTFFPNRPVYTDPLINPYTVTAKFLVNNKIVKLSDSTKRYLKMQIGLDIFDGENNNNEDSLIDSFDHFVACSKEFLIDKVPFRDREFYLGSSLYDFKDDMFDSNILSQDFFLKKSKRKKIVYFSLGTMPHKIDKEKAIKYFNLVLKSFIQTDLCKKFDLVVSAGAFAKELETEYVHESIAIYEWVSQSSVLKHASVVISHGGLGTIKECINEMVPLIIIPLGYDQFNNAKRVEFHKLGIALDSNYCTTEIVQNLILELDKNAIFIDNLIKMKSFFVRDSVSILKLLNRVLM